MAKLIDLFGDNALSGRDLVTSPPKNLSDMAVSGVVSPTGVQYALELANRVMPKVDYSDFKSFVFFNSAVDYFNITGDRMIAQYPYDGDYDEFLAFKSASDGYENYMIDAWPHWSGTGYFTSGVFAIVGDTSNVSSHSALLALSDTSSLKLTVPLTLEYRLLFPTSPVLPSGTSITVLAQHFSVTGTGPDYTHPNFSVFLSSSASVPTINFHLSGAGFTGSNSLGSQVWYPIPEASGAAGYYMAWVMTPPTGTTSGTLQFYKTNAGANQYPFTDAFNVDGYGVPQVINWTFNTGSTYSTGSSALVVGLHPSASLPFTAAKTPSDFQLTELRYWTMARDSADIYRTYNNRIFKGEPLQIYWRFAEKYLNPGRVPYIALRDYSGHRLDATVYGTTNITSFWVPAAARSGGIGMSSADLGEPLLSPRAQEVINFVTDKQASGTLYDRNNANLITNLVPQQFIYLEDDKGTAVMKNLLYLLGRQFDELKVSIDQTKYLLTADYTEFNTTPDAMLDDVLKFWGWSTKGNFLSKEAFQWFFGLSVLDRTPQDIEQGVFSNERLEVELFKIKNEFWRRTLNNLAYLYKTKGTKESVESLFRIYGLDESVVKLKEYGLKPFVKIETNRINSLKSHSVLKIDRTQGTYGVQTIGQPISISSGTWTIDMQIAFPAYGPSGRMPPASGSAAGATGSIYYLNQASGGRLARPLAFPLGSAGSIILGDSAFEHLYYEREWRSGTLTKMGRLVYTADDGVSPSASVTFDNLPIFDGRWYHLSMQRSGSTYRLDVQFNDTDRMGAKAADNSPTAEAIPYVKSGTLAAVLAPNTLGLTLGYRPMSLYPIGQFWAHNVQVWGRKLSDTDRADHTINPFSHGVETPDQHEDLRLNWQFDTLIDSDNNVYLDSAKSVNHGQLIGSGPSISGSWNPNVYDRFNFSYNFIAPPDYNWTEEKIRYLDTPRPDPRDHWNEINDVGIEFNLIDALNEDISMMMSTMDNWNNVIGDPANRYRDTYPTLEKLRQQYFTRLTGRINFRVFIDYLDFFDRSFVELVKRLLPARIDFQGAEIVIESHMLERPKVQYNYRRQNPQLVPEGVIRIYGYAPLVLAEYMDIDADAPPPEVI